jgi:hypothetical protein
MACSEIQIQLNPLERNVSGDNAKKTSPTTYRISGPEIGRIPKGIKIEVHWKASHLSFNLIYFVQSINDECNNEKW